MTWRFRLKNWFLLGLLAALLLGIFFPEADGILNPRSITRTLLIALLFLIAGFTLPSEAIKQGLRDYRLHLFIQIFLFVITPAYFMLTTLPLRQNISRELLIGIYALACLPTTIASCVVFTQLSGGNVTGSLVNAALANILGVFLSPLLLSLLLRAAGRTLPATQLLSVLKDLGLQILVPLAAGQGLRLILREFAVKRKGMLAQASNLFLLIIIFLSFARSANDPAFLRGLRNALWLFPYLAASHLILVFLSYAGARLLRFSQADLISVLFTAPQKTLAMGVPLLTAYFSRSPEILGMAMLPLLFYHPWQLLIAGILRSAVGAKPPSST